MIPQVIRTELHRNNQPADRKEAYRPDLHERWQRVHHPGPAGAGHPRRAVRQRRPNQPGGPREDAGRRPGAHKRPHRRRPKGAERHSSRAGPTRRQQLRLQTRHGNQREAPAARPDKRRRAHRAVRSTRGVPAAAGAREAAGEGYSGKARQERSEGVLHGIVRRAEQGQD